MAARTAAPRERRQLGRWVVPPSGVILGWAGGGAHGAALGFATAVLVGLAFALLWPLLTLLVLESPGALIPARWRMWWRRGAIGRPHIKNSLRRLVYAADGYACAWCHANDPNDLELDHMRPWSFGGRTSFWNFMTLCGPCNRVKSNYWRFRDGREYYTPFKSAGNIRAARAIHDFERRHRWSIMRLIRASMAL